MGAKGKKHKRTGGNRSTKSGSSGRVTALWERVKLFLSRNRAVVRACIIFAVCIGVFTFTLTMLMRGDALVGLQDFTAGATGFFVNLFGSEVQVDGSIISSPSGTPLEIIPECLGIISMAIYASAVLAYPCRLKQKMLGIAIGIVALFVLNLVRTVSLFYIGSHFPDFLETAHVLIWQSVMILAAIALWLFWVEKLARVPAR